MLLSKLKKNNGKKKFRTATNGRKSDYREFIDLQINKIVKFEKLCGVKESSKILQLKILVVSIVIFLSHFVHFRTAE